MTIQGLPVPVSSAQTFAGPLAVVPGTTVFTITATDASGNTATARYEVDVSDAPKTFTYDANGNLTTDGARTFEWDARNQLVAVTVGTHRSEFTYDGLQRRVRQVEKDNGVTTADTWVLWCETAICEERAADGVTVTRRAFGLGEQVNGAARYFTTDHLGSVREVTATGGAPLARYAFDPWGRRTVTAGTDVTTVGFTGHRTHASSGLAMALYRGYDAGLGRWVSEDPILLASGRINFYEYADQQPLRLVDPLGLTSRGIVTVLTFRHLCDFHTYRNARNRCPPRDPNGGQGFTWDALFKKYRHKDGSECKYDSCGRLLPDDGNNYTYNYEPSYDTPGAFSRHVWLDVLPTFYCGAVAPGHGRTR